MERANEPSKSAIEMTLGVFALICALRVSAVDDSLDRFVGRLAPEASPLTADVSLQRFALSHTPFEEGAVCIWLASWCAAFLLIGLAALLNAARQEGSLDRLMTRKSLARCSALALALVSAAVWFSASMPLMVSSDSYVIEDYWPPAVTERGMLYSRDLSVPLQIRWVVLLGVGLFKWSISVMFNVARIEGPIFRHSMTDLILSLLVLPLSGVIAGGPWLQVKGIVILGAPWIPVALALLALAAAIHHFRIGLDQRFGHHPLSCAVLIGALWLLCEGAISAVGGTSGRYWFG